MKKNEAIDRAVEFIAKRGSARTPDIASHLGVSPVRISSMLWPACRSGRLVSCSVERPGKPPCNEYRIGAGQPQAGMTPMQTYRRRGADAMRHAAETRDAALAPTPDVAPHSKYAPGPNPVLDDSKAAPARWALTSDGTFVELGKPHPIEIPSASARGLVEFIRRLDAAEV